MSDKDNREGFIKGTHRAARRIRKIISLIERPKKHRLTHRQQRELFNEAQDLMGRLAIVRGSRFVD